MGDITYDIEASNLLNQESIDYTQSPFRLKEDFEVHCIVVEVHETEELIAFYDGPTYILDGRTYNEKGKLGYTYTLEDYEPVGYTHKPLDEFPEWIKRNMKKGDRVVAHNGINYDKLVCKLYFGMDYEINADKGGLDTWHGQEVVIEDTMVTSKTLNPDRFGGHSLDNLGKYAKLDKIEFRKSVPQKDRFKEFAADMVYYNIRDSRVNTKVFKYLEWEKGDWAWEEPIRLEKCVADIITRQSHRGFKFDKELAESNITELDALMEERRQRVEPVLPPRPATKKFLKEHTPPASQLLIKEVTPPKTQFKKNGEPSKTLENFIEKYGSWIDEDTVEIQGVEYSLPLPLDLVVYKEYNVAAHMVNFVNKHEGAIHNCQTKVTLFGQEYELPLPVEPLKTEMVATIDDTTHIKNWLVGLGWNPSEYKDKDITVKSGPAKKKRTEEEIEEAVDKYIKETLESNFKSDRLSHLEATEKTVRRKLLQRALKRSVKVLTNPSFTVGQDKEMCPDLERIAEKFPYAKDVVEYLTYKHRRNSILGGGLEFDDWEEEAEKGYLSNVREDGRIATPADTCGAATSRMKHKEVANIPRVTSLYGKEMRSLFGVDEGFFQLGYDFDSLEAKEEAHYCWRYEGQEKSYCKSLTLDKPNDVHTKMAQAISKIIGDEFGRSPAKAVKYGCTYGAQEAKVAKTIGKPLEVGTLVFNAFWQAAAPLKKLKDALQKYWENVGGKKFILGIDGRKVPTRAAHAILNSLFQSAGVICAKRAMVIHDRLLQAEGLIVDFFKDDWKNAKFFQQLIAYHDESQGEVSRSLVSFKVFDSKEEAEEFKASATKIWSDVQKGKNDKFFVAYCRAGELASEAVRLSGEYYNLNVPLTAGYMLGRNWADCH